MTAGRRSLYDILELNFRAQLIILRLSLLNKSEVEAGARETVGDFMYRVSQFFFPKNHVINDVYVTSHTFLMNSILQ